MKKAVLIMALAVMLAGCSTEIDVVGVEEEVRAIETEWVSFYYTPQTGWKVTIEADDGVDIKSDYHRALMDSINEATRKHSAYQGFIGND